MRLTDLDGGQPFTPLGMEQKPSFEITKVKDAEKAGKAALEKVERNSSFRSDVLNLNGWSRVEPDSPASDRITKMFFALAEDDSHRRTDSIADGSLVAFANEAGVTNLLIGWPKVDEVMGREVAEFSVGSWQVKLSADSQAWWIKHESCTHHSSPEVDGDELVVLWAMAYIISNNHKLGGIDLNDTFEATGETGTEEEPFRREVREIAHFTVAEFLGQETTTIAA